MGFNKKFTQMIEHNEHEGESWCYWLQVDGNEDALSELDQLIETEGVQEYYELTGITIYEWEVDTLINYGNFGYGYMNQHHKIAGKLDISDEEDTDSFYKSGIKDFFKES